MNDKMKDVRNERLVKEQKVGPIFEKRHSEHKKHQNTNLI